MLKDKKGDLFIVVADDDRPIDLRRLHVHIGAQGRLAAELIHEIPNVEPGSLPPLSLLHDRALRVKPVIDAALMEADQLNFDPLVNTESTGITPQSLLTIIASCRRVPLFVDFDAMAMANRSA